MDGKKKSERSEHQYTPIDSVTSTFKLISESKRKATHLHAQQSRNEKPGADSNFRYLRLANRYWKHPTAHQYVYSVYPLIAATPNTTAMLTHARKKSEKIKHELEAEPGTSTRKKEGLKKNISMHRNKSQNDGMIIGRERRRTVNQLTVDKPKKSLNIANYRRPPSHRGQTRESETEDPGQLLHKFHQRLEASNSHQTLKDGTPLPSVIISAHSILDAIRNQHEDEEYNKKSAKLHRKCCGALKGFINSYNCTICICVSAVAFVVFFSIVIIVYPIVKAFSHANKQF